MVEPYVESETRHFERSGEAFTINYDFSKIHPYALAKSLHYGKARNRQLAAQYFAQRTAWVLDEAAKSISWPEKPAREERARLRETIQQLRAIWNISGEYLADKVLHDTRGLKYNSNKRKDKGIETINRAVFNRRLQEIASWYVLAGHGVDVLRDLALAQQVKNDPSHFALLEERCERALTRFASNSIAGMDEESLYQEGLVVAWQASKNYQGKNFARLNTFVGRALANKHIDLIRYFSAHCRRAVKNSFAMGLGEEGSRLQDRLDDVSFHEWKDRQRSGDLEDGWPAPPKGTSIFETKYAVLEGTVNEVDDATYPLGLERRIELISEGERLVRDGEADVTALCNWRAECGIRAIMNNPQITPQRRKRFLFEYGLSESEIDRMMIEAGYVNESQKVKAEVPF